MAIPLCATSEHVCLADESHISILATASLRQVAAIEATANGAAGNNNNNSKASPSSAATAAAAPIIALHADPVTGSITTVDVDGAVVTRQPSKGSSGADDFALPGAGSKKASLALTAASSTSLRYPHLLTAASAHKRRDPEADVSVLTATIVVAENASASLLSGGPMSDASKFFVPTDNLLTARQARRLSGAEDAPTAASFSSSSSLGVPLVVSALLSDGTVLHGGLSMAQPVPAVGVVPASARKARPLLAASPTMPLTVVGQHGSNVIALFYEGQQQQEQEQQDSQLASSSSAAAAGAANKNKTASKSGKKSSFSASKSAADEPQAAIPEPVFVTVPVNVASIAVHPSRRAVAIGGARGEIIVIQDILAFAGVVRGGNTNFFSDHWHHTPLTSLCYAGGPDGPMLLSGGSEGCLCIWNVGSNYARTNVSLGTGISEVARVSSIQLAVDAPSRAVVCVGEGDVQIASVDLSYRRMVARRDGLTAGGGSSSLLLLSSGADFGDDSATQLSAPVQWMAGGAVTALFLFCRRSGRIRLYDPYERRSLRTSVLTASVETVPNPPTVGLQRVASTANGRRVAVFESSPEPVMPPALRWLVYDGNLRRFRQVQQAIDPHSGETELMGMVWVHEDKTSRDSSSNGDSGRVALITCSAKRIKVWMTMEDSMVAKLPAGAAKQQKKRTQQQFEEKYDSNDDHTLMMNCVAEIMLPHHPALSMIGALRCAALSEDHSVLYVAGDVVAAIDARHWFTARKAETSSSPAVALAAPSESNLGSAHTIAATAGGGVAAAFSNAVGIFGVSGGSFRCRAMVRAAQPSDRILALSAAPSSDFAVAVIAGSSHRYEVALVDVAQRCEIVARSPWHRHYAPASHGSFVLLSGIDAATVGGDSGCWRCSVGVATMQRGFRALTVLFTPKQQQHKNKKKLAADEQPLVALAPAATSEIAKGAAERMGAVQDQVSSFFKHADDSAISKGAGAAASPYSSNTIAGSERSLFQSCGSQVQIAKAAAKYGTEVLGATTFFAAPSMSAVSATVFDRLEGGE